MTELTVIYGDTEIKVPATTDLQDLKVAMAENFPELNTASVTQVGSTVVFSAKAGTKGTDELTVVYGDTEFKVPGTTELSDLKLAMAENFPELNTATVTKVENTVVFSAKAGTKGK